MCEFETRFHSILQNYAEYKEELHANASKRRDELGDILWSCLESKLSANGDGKEHHAIDRGSAYSAFVASPKAADRGSLSAFPNSPMAAEKISVAALAAEKGNPRPSKNQLLKGGTFGELIRDDEQGFKSETLLLNSWQPESKSGDKPRSCHMQTMKLKCKNHEGDVKVYWNKRKPPG